MAASSSDSKSTKTIEINQHSIRVCQEQDKQNPDSTRIVDVVVRVDREKAKAFLQLFPQKHITSNENAYAGILQSGCAQYFRKRTFDPHLFDHDGCLSEHVPDERAIEGWMRQVQSCVTPLVALEEWTNNHAKIEDPLKLLRKQVKACHTNLIAVLDGGSKEAKDLREILEENTTSFMAAIDRAGSRASQDKIQQLFCVQQGSIDGSTDLPALGDFIANQIACIAHHGKKVVDRFIPNGSLSLKSHPAKEALSDIESEVQFRKSLAGVTTNNSRQAIDLSLLKSIDFNFNEPKNVSDQAFVDIPLSLYADELSDLESVGQMLDFLIKKESALEQKHEGSQPIKMMTPGHLIGEMVLGILAAAACAAALLVALPLTLILELVLTACHIIFSFVSCVVYCIETLLRSKTDDQRAAKSIDQWVTYFHHHGSLLRRLWGMTTNADHLIQKYSKNIDNESQAVHRDLLNELSRNPPNLFWGSGVEGGGDNYFNGICSSYLSGSFLGSCAVEFFSSVLSIFSKLNAKMSFSFWNPSDEEYEALLTEKYKEMKGSQQGVLNQPATEDLPRGAGQMIVRAIPWKQPRIPSVANVLSNMVVIPAEIFDKMFRDQPLITIPAFAISTTAFIGLVTQFSVLHPIALLPRHVNAAMGGEFDITGVVDQGVASFLTFKVMVVAAEAGIHAVIEGDMLKAIAELNLNKITFGVCGLTAVGHALSLLHYTPNIPLPILQWHQSGEIFLSVPATVLTFPLHQLQSVGETASLQHPGFIVNSATEYMLMSLQAGAWGQVLGSVESIQKEGGESGVRWKDEERTNARPSDTSLHSSIELIDEINAVSAASNHVPFEQKKTSFFQDLEVRCFQDLEMLHTGNLIFKNRREAMVFLDELSKDFDRYNALLKKAHRSPVDFSDALHYFDNQYIKKDSEWLLWRVAWILPNLLLRPLWYAASNQSPAVGREMEQSYQEDLAMILKLLGALGRMLHTLAGAIDTCLQFVFGCILVALLAVFCAGFFLLNTLKSPKEVREISLADYLPYTLKDIYQIVSYINLQGIDLYNKSICGYSLHSIYAYLSRHIDREAPPNALSTAAEKAANAMGGSFLKGSQYTFFKSPSASLMKLPEKRKDERLDLLLSRMPSVG